MEVSIIMPVCNSQKYIFRAVKSAVNQDFDSFELIIVDYGSVDDSRLICAQFEKKYNNVKIIDCTERNIYSALNKGIKEAAGVFVIFALCEGFYYNDYIKSLYLKQEETRADIIVFGAKIIDTVRKKELIFSPEEHCGNTAGFFEYYKNIYSDNYKNINMICGKLFKKEILEKNYIKFPEYDSNGHEEFIYNYLAVCKSVSQSRACIYDLYVYPPESIDTDITPFYELAEYRLKLFEKEGIELNSELEYSFRVYSAVEAVLYDICSDKGLSLREKKRLIRKVFENSSVESGIKKYAPFNREEKWIKFFMDNRLFLFTYIFILMYLKKNFIYNF